MTATVTAIMAQIAVLQRTIIDPVSGLAVVSFDNVPYTLSKADMPCFVTFVREGSQNILMGNDYKGRDFNDIRTYAMVLYHSPFGSGITEEKIGLLSPWFDLVYTEFMKYPHLNGTAGVVDAKIVSDSGASVQEFIGQQYYGIRFALQVTRRSRWLLDETD